MLWRIGADGEDKMRDDTGGADWWQQQQPLELWQQEEPRYGAQDNAPPCAEVPNWINSERIVECLPN
jgi:hypothetical protein